MPDKNDEERILADLKWGKSDDSIIVFIPSKDAKSNPVNDQAQWADVAANLFGRLFGGATGFKDLIGTWFDEKSKAIIAEHPIMIHSLTKRDKLENPANLKELVDFCKRM